MISTTLALSDIPATFYPMVLRYLNGMQTIQDLFLHEDSTIISHHLRSRILSAKDYQLCPECPDTFIQKCEVSPNTYLMYNAYHYFATSIQITTTELDTIFQQLQQYIDYIVTDKQNICLTGRGLFQVLVALSEERERNVHTWFPLWNLINELVWKSTPYFIDDYALMIMEEEIIQMFDRINEINEMQAQRTRTVGPQQPKMLKSRHAQEKKELAIAKKFLAKIAV